MKQYLTALIMLTALTVTAQTKDELSLAEKTSLLSHTVFGSKDSVQLEKLFARKLSYGHSRGKLETRPEAIRGIIRNASVYTDTAIAELKIIVEKKTAIVRHVFSAKEHKADGTIVPLKFSILLVWTKRNGEWRLLARQAVALP